LNSDRDTAASGAAFESSSGKQQQTGSSLDAEAELVRARLEMAGLHTEIADKRTQIEHMRFELAASQALLLRKEQLLESITQSLGWRLLSRYGPIKHAYVLPALRWLKSLVRPGEYVPADSGVRYRDWVRLCESYRYNPERAERRMAEFKYRPVISIVVPTYNTSPEYLRKAVESVLRQYYPHWEMCIADDSSTDPAVRDILRQYADEDARIKVALCERNSGIAAASNRALEMASGDFVGFLDHDDELAPDALFEVAATLQRFDADLIYSDEDKLDTDGARSDAFLKPAWSPDLLLSTMYTCHFSVYRTEILRRIGGFREGYEGSQDYDLVLRFTEQTDRIAHIPKILYHWRKAPGSSAANPGAKPYAYGSAGRALSDAVRRRQLDAAVIPEPASGHFRVKRAITKPGKVSIVIPTRDALGLLSRCITSIEKLTGYKDYEIIIVDNGSRKHSTLDYLSNTAHRVIREPGPFNFSLLNNAAAKVAQGDYLLLLNNDTEVISPEWLTSMVEHAQRPEVGAVGAKLLFSDGRIQHAGVILGIGGVAGHSHRLLGGKEERTYFNFPNMVREYGAVTGACLMIRRDLYNQIGGLDEANLAVTFNDVDLCLRLRKKGFLIVYTPYALLYHHESATRGKRVAEREISYMIRQWGEEILSDPYYNPNLSFYYEDFSIDWGRPEAIVRSYEHDHPNEAIPLPQNGNTVGQSIFSTQDDLCAIAVKFRKKHLKLGGKVTLHLRATAQDGPELALSTASTSLIPVNDYYMFCFDPIEGSAGRKFYFYLEFDGLGTSGLTVYKSTKDNPVVGPHYEDHQPAAGALCFRVFFHQQFRCIQPISRKLANLNSA
jgi:GT2 family glycosyltransferase